MNLLSRPVLRTLFENQEEPCISIVMPVERAGPQVRQNLVRLKNLLVRAEDYLNAQGMRPEPAHALMDPVRRMLDPWHPVWTQRATGLSVFRSPKVFQYNRLPMTPDETMIVGRHFHIKPVLPILVRDGVFYILALSRGRVRLLQCTRETWQEVELNAPSSFAEAMQFSETRAYTAVYSSGRSARGEGGAGIFYGQGQGTDGAAMKADVIEFLKVLEKGIEEQLAGVDSPMVLAGVNYMCALYREVSRYPRIMESTLDGNPDDRPEDDLHREALAIVEPHFDEGRDRALAAYQQLASHHQRVSHRTDEILNRAWQGHVQTLFISLRTNEWGQFTPETGETVAHAEEQPGDEDLLNLAATYTLMHNGDVYPLEAGLMPGGPGAAAILRF